MCLRPGFRRVGPRRMPPLSQLLTSCLIHHSRQPTRRPTSGVRRRWTLKLPSDHHLREYREISPGEVPRKDPLPIGSKSVKDVEVEMSEGRPHAGLTGWSSQRGPVMICVRSERESGKHRHVVRMSVSHSAAGHHIEFPRPECTHALGPRVVYVSCAELSPRAASCAALLQ